MKILLTNFSLDRLAGSETWTMTMFAQLVKLGHDVDIFVASSEDNTLISATCDKNKSYDLAIINHNNCLYELQDWRIKRRVFTSHGVIPGLEQPIPGADVYVSVSEEVQTNLYVKGFTSTIIRNPINTEYFTFVKQNKDLKKILWMNNNKPIPEMIEPVSVGYEYRTQWGWRTGVKENIQWADLVVSSGRGIYEALSCGKNAMVVNWCGCDGMVTEDTILEFRKTNCSGRTNKVFWNPDRMRQEFDKYDSSRDLRPYIIENNNIATVARRYLVL